MTKMYVLPVLLLCLTITSSAQFEKGQKVVGGNVGLFVANSDRYNNNNYKTTYTSITVSPTLGWFTTTNQLWGVGLNYNFNLQKYKSYDAVDSTKIYNHSVGLSVLSQHYFPLFKNLFFTLNSSATVSYIFGENIQTSGYNFKTTGYGFNISLAPGLTYKINRRLLFDGYLSNLLNVGYSHNSMKNRNNAQIPNGTSDQLVVSSSFSNTSLGSVGLGFRWLLKK